MRTLFLLAASAAVLLTAATPSLAADPAIWINNNTDSNIEHVYVAQPGDEEYDSTDLLGDDVINPGEGEWVYPDYVKNCRYWVEVELDDGTYLHSTKPVWACRQGGGTLNVNN